MTLFKFEDCTVAVETNQCCYAELSGCHMILMLSNVQMECRNKRATTTNKEKRKFIHYRTDFLNAGNNFLPDDNVKDLEEINKQTKKQKTSTVL